MAESNGYRADRGEPLSKHDKGQLFGSRAKPQVVANLLAPLSKMNRYR